MPTGSRRLFLLLWTLALAGVVALALWPWWRHHGYLRDLYDYGLVIAANGHLDLGERPYVDFTTPIQAGFLGLNWLAERAGGGGYAGLTRGAAVLIALTATGLPLLLAARRWPWWAALAVGGAVAVSAPSQHTVLWHNALGVVALALAVWSVAIAPTPRGEDWPWHGLAMLGLFLGGINKLNFQLVALAACLAWGLRAGLVRAASWPRVLVGTAAMLLAGVVAPVAAELAWTGASLRLWWANVVTLPTAGRTGLLHEIGTVHFWVRPIHDYYGPLLLPQVGLMAIGLSAAAVVGCWSGAGRGRVDRVLLLAAALAALAGGAGLLATNYEIAPLGLGAWLVLVASLWLGFDPPRRGTRFVVGLVLPSVLLGAAAWRSAWLGQRSQFGYASFPRSDYREAASAGPAFAYLRGLRLPPDVIDSMRAIERSLPEADAAGRRPVFFGLGTEWMERGFPTTGEKGRPLWVHWMTSYSAADIAALGRQLGTGDYRTVFTTIARDEWPEELRPILRREYFSDLVGPVVKRWIFRGEAFVDLNDSFAVLDGLGGNVDGRILHQDNFPVGFARMSDGRRLLGTSRQFGAVLLRRPSYHLRGIAAITRLPGSGNDRGVVDFKIINHGGIPEEVRWQGRLELAPGQTSASVPFDFDTFGKMVQLWVMPGAGTKGGAFFGGYRDLQLVNSIESTEGDGVPRVRDNLLPETPVTAETGRSLFGDLAWRPQRWVLRGGRAGASGLELVAGGETWLHSEAMTGEVRGRLQLAPGTTTHPRVRIVWYKGGRLELMQHGRVMPDQPFDFHVWTAEPGGWIGFVVEPEAVDGAVSIRINSVSLQP